VAAARSCPSRTHPWPQNGYVSIGTGTAALQYPLEVVEPGVQPAVNVVANGNYRNRAGMGPGGNANATGGWVMGRDLLAQRYKDLYWYDIWTGSMIRVKGRSERFERENGELRHEIEEIKGRIER
jgi:hypothetical protein